MTRRVLTIFSFVDKLGSQVNLDDYEIDVSAALLKVFIRELPTPLIGLKLSEDMGALPGKRKSKFKTARIHLLKPSLN